MSVGEAPRFSFVVPAFNVGSFLPQCISSILGQTVADLEVIVVDDGSTDCTGKVADDFSLVDGRVRVIHQGNAGPSAARNRGMREARGEWLFFIDGDDWVSPSLADSVWKAMMSLGGDVGIYRYRFEDMATGLSRASHDAWYWSTHIGSKPTVVPRTTWMLLDCVTSKVYRRRWLLESGVTFCEGLFYEDVLQHVSLACKSSVMVAIPDVLYQYRIGRPGQTSMEAASRAFHILTVMRYAWEAIATTRDDAMPSFLVLGGRAIPYLLGRLPVEQRERFAEGWCSFAFDPQRRERLRPWLSKLPAAGVSSEDMVKSLLVFASPNVFNHWVLRRRTSLPAIKAALGLLPVLGLGGSWAYAAAIWRSRSELLNAWLGRRR